MPPKKSVATPQPPAPPAAAADPLPSPPVSVAELKGLDSSRISVLAAKKVSKQKLLNIGDSDAGQVSGKELQIRRVAQVKEKKCCLCCAAFGGAISMIMSLMLSSAATLYCLHVERHRVQTYTFPIVARHIVWLALPGAACGATLHFLLADAMWSSRRNSWGTAWTKALGANTALWLICLTGGTFGWRKILRHTRWSKLYYRYPIPAEPLELRLIMKPDQFWSGMGWTYWSIGAFIGQIGYACCAALCVYNNRIHFLMSPVGPYAMACIPRWRREQIARNANYELTPTQ